MDRLTVVELKALAKKKGLVGYSKLRKAELVSLMNKHSGKRSPAKKASGKKASGKSSRKKSSAARNKGERYEVVTYNYGPGSFNRPGETKVRSDATVIRKFAVKAYKDIIPRRGWAYIIIDEKLRHPPHGDFLFASAAEAKRYAKAKGIVTLEDNRIVWHLRDAALL